VRGIQRFLTCGRRVVITLPDDEAVPFGKRAQPCAKLGASGDVTHELAGMKVVATRQRFASLKIDLERIEATIERSRAVSSSAQTNTAPCVPRLVMHGVGLAAGRVRLVDQIISPSATEFSVSVACKLRACYGRFVQREIGGIRGGSPGVSRRAPAALSRRT